MTWREIRWPDISTGIRWSELRSFSLFRAKRSLSFHVKRATGGSRHKEAAWRKRGCTECLLWQCSGVAQSKGRRFFCYVCCVLMPSAISIYLRSCECMCSLEFYHLFLSICFYWMIFFLSACDLLLHLFLVFWILDLTPESFFFFVDCIKIFFSLYIFISKS